MQRPVETVHQDVRIGLVHRGIGGRFQHHLRHFRKCEILANDVLFDHVNVSFQLLGLTRVNASDNGSEDIVTGFVQKLSEGGQAPPTLLQLEHPVRVPENLYRLFLSAYADRRLQFLHFVSLCDGV